RMSGGNEMTGELWEVGWDQGQQRYTQQVVGRAPGRWSTSGFGEQGTELEAGCFAIKVPRLPNWTDWNLVPGGFNTDRAPAAATDVSGDIAVFSKNLTNRQVYLNSLERQQGAASVEGSALPPDPDGSLRQWRGWRRDAQEIVTPHALACSSHNRRMYAFAVRTDGSIVHKFYTDDEVEVT